MIRQAVVLCGGLGTRLGELTRHTPKPLLDVGGRPFLAFLVDELRRHGLEHILLLGGFAGDAMARFAASAGAEVEVLVEPEPLGTGGALRFALPRLDDAFFLLNGDSLFDLNLWDLALLLEDGADGAFALRSLPDASRYGIVDTIGERITAFRARPPAAGPGVVNGGVAALRRSLVADLPADKAVSLEAEVLPGLAAAGRLKGRVYDRPFIDIGVPDEFARAQTFVPRTTRRGAVVFDRDGVLNHDAPYAHRPDQIVWIDGAIEAVKAVNDAGLFAFVATNQSGVARGYYGEEDVQSLHRWMNAELRRHGAHVDAFAYSPFHPEGVVERYRAVTDCRKPGPGMLRALFAAAPVDLARTVMIGDSPTDVEAARAAGIEGRLYEGGALDAVVKPLVLSLAGGDERLRT